MGNTQTKKSSGCGGWSNEPTMWDWGAVNPMGVLISKEKPNLCYINRDKDRASIVDFLQKIEWFGDDLEQVNVEEILNHLYR
jgi:hypothetical protein